MEIKKEVGYSKIGSDHDRPLDQVQWYTRYVAPIAQRVREIYNFKFSHTEGKEIFDVINEEKITLVLKLVFRFNFFREL